MTSNFFVLGFTGDSAEALGDIINGWIGQTEREGATLFNILSVQYQVAPTLEHSALVFFEWEGDEGEDEFSEGAAGEGGN